MFAILFRLLRRGEAWVKDWMAENCKFHTISENKVLPAMPELTKFIHGLQGSGKLLLDYTKIFWFSFSYMRPFKALYAFQIDCVAQSYLLISSRFIVAAIDSTVWSYNDSVAEQIQMLSTIVNMGPCALGYIQLPAFQAQTTMHTLLKRKRLVEDSLLKKDIDFSNAVTLHFQKETVRVGTDKRPTSQQALLCFTGKQNEWLSSAAVSNGVIGPLPIVSVSDMQGYDPDSKPGAAARAEQFLGRVFHSDPANV